MLRQLICTPSADGSVWSIIENTPGSIKARIQKDTKRQKQKLPSLAGFSLVVVNYAPYTIHLQVIDNNTQENDPAESPRQSKDQRSFVGENQEQQQQDPEIVANFRARTGDTVTWSPHLGFFEGVLHVLDRHQRR